VKTLPRFRRETNRDVAKTTGVLHGAAILQILGRTLGLRAELGVKAMQTSYGRKRRGRWNIAMRSIGREMTLRHVDYII